MKKKKDNPKVYIPPPLIFIGIFIAAIFIHKILPINTHFFQSRTSMIIGLVVILSSLFFNLSAFRQFFKTNNTVITIKPATSLQTTGIYSLSRNPMYFSFMLLYVGFSFIIGNW